jgi:hypothetical protein
MNTPAKCLAAAILLASIAFISAEINAVTNIATDVYFHEGDLKGQAHSKNGWIVFEE